jgi:hypothetical protein
MHCAQWAQAAQPHRASVPPPPGRRGPAVQRCRLVGGLRPAQQWPAEVAPAARRGHRAPCRPVVAAAASAASTAAAAAVHHAQDSLLGHSPWGERASFTSLSWNLAVTVKPCPSSTHACLNLTTACVIRLPCGAGIWAALTVAGCAGLWCERTKWGKEMSGALLRWVGCWLHGGAHSRALYAASGASHK